MQVCGLRILRSELGRPLVLLQLRKLFIDVNSRYTMRVEIVLPAAEHSRSGGMSWINLDQSMLLQLVLLPEEFGDVGEHLIVDHHL